MSEFDEELEDDAVIPPLDDEEEEDDAPVIPGEEDDEADEEKLGDHGFHEDDEPPATEL